MARCAGQLLAPAVGLGIIPGFLFAFQAKKKPFPQFTLFNSIVVYSSRRGLHKSDNQKGEWTNHRRTIFCLLCIVMCLTNTFYHPLTLIMKANVNRRHFLKKIQKLSTSDNVILELPLINRIDIQGAHCIGSTYYLMVVDRPFHLLLKKNIF